MNGIEKLDYTEIESSRIAGLKKHIRDLMVATLILFAPQSTLYNENKTFALQNTNIALLGQTLGENISNMSLGELNLPQTQSLFLKLFGNGPGTKYFFSFGNKDLLQIIIAIGYNEGNFEFGKLVKDYIRGYDIGTFQIWGKTKKTAKERYNELFRKGSDFLHKKFAHEEGLKISQHIGELSEGQKDLIAYIGYLKEREKVLGLNENIETLIIVNKQDIHTIIPQIQGSIKELGERVYKTLKETRIYKIQQEATSTTPTS